MPVDRLTQIRHNWQEKGNGPRGRDVDFLLGLLDEPGLDEANEHLRFVGQELRDAAAIGNPAILELAMKRERIARWSAALPATESAQPEEEPNG